MYKTSAVWILILLIHFATFAEGRKTPNLTHFDTQLKFIENKGQWKREVLFKADIPGGSAFLLKSALVYVFYDVEKIKKNGRCHGCFNSDDKPRARRLAATPESKGLSMHAVWVNFAGSNPGVSIDPLHSSTERYNYFLGSDPSQWGSNARAFAEVYYNNLYEGIDLRLYSENGNLKYDFIVQSGADPQAIQLEYAGLDKMYIKDNRLYLNTSVNNWHEQIPIAYQLDQKDTIAVECGFQQKKNRISFHIAQYDTSLPLVIDPLLIFSTFSGSTANNWGNTATYDEEGSLYSGGIAQGVGFPATEGAYQVSFSGIWDVSILKFDSTGSELLYATYLGGAYAETPQSMVVNGNGDLLVFGTTSSLDFPTLNGYQTSYKGGDSTVALPGVEYTNGSDMFIARLSFDGSTLLSSTLMGGTANDGINYNFNPLVKNYGDQYRGDIFVDATNNVYVASSTHSADFPIVNAFQDTFGGDAIDAVVFRMSPDLSQLTWSSFLGGDGSDAAYSIKVTPADSVYVAGGTSSSDFVTTPGAYLPDKPGDVDGFIVKINQAAYQIDQASYVGTEDYDQAYFLDIDESGNIYLFGQTNGDYPITRPGGESMYVVENSGQFIHKLTADLTMNGSSFSTVFGSGSGSPDISPTAFLVNECGDIFISGWGGTINDPVKNTVTGYIGGNTHGLPITSDALKDTTDGSDFYLAVFRQNAEALLYATFFGGNESPGEHVDGGTSRFDKRGIVYQAVCAGCQSGHNSNYFTTPGAYSEDNKSPTCNNAAFKFDMASLRADFTTNSPYFFDQPGLEEGCFPLDVIFLNQSIGGKNFFWEFGNGATSQKKDSVIVRFEEPGVYYANLIASDPSTCARLDQTTKYITVLDHDFAVSPSDTICFGDVIRLQASGGQDYHWEPAEGLSDPTIAAPLASPRTTTTYVVRATNEDDCRLRDTVSVHVTPETIIDFEVEKVYDCLGFPTIHFINKSTGAENYRWQFGDGTVSTEENPKYQYQKDSIYTVSLESVSPGCLREKSIELTVRESTFPNIFTPNGDRINDSFVLNTDAEVRLEVYNRWGAKVFESDNYQNDWTGGDLKPGVYFVQVAYPDSRQCRGWVHLMR